MEAINNVILCFYAVNIVAIYLEIRIPLNYSINGLCLFPVVRPGLALLSYMQKTKTLSGTLCKNILRSGVNFPKIEIQKGIFFGT